MRRLIAAVSLFALAGCSYVGVGATPRSRFSPQPTVSSPVVIQVGKSDPEPLEGPKAEEEKPSTAVATDDPGATQ
ncbi:hypothetical protein COCOR_07199 [Corallococcus coralloides DSM 2259]|uniref:Lipoprotein n=1 Tax=Corallococcus coralloides (strain ATCC 25202 / DSM 2259 / NBRC 100086 / M2) TaxID=1144275 RepID=H8MIL1_CORCM|nr:hypothetical protein [Corallococcus coralloides]AFE07389.1 hypothetical protein COCOR_07199 [Corallococcus coralloides DSM 2259]